VSHVSERGTNESIFVSEDIRQESEGLLLPTSCHLQKNSEQNASHIRPLMVRMRSQVAIHESTGEAWCRRNCPGAVLHLAEVCK
jgi:hypothetical protein